MEIINDDESDASVPLQTPGDCAHRENVIARFVVNKYRRLGERLKRVAYAVEVILFLHLPSPQFPRVDERFRREHAVNKLFGAHFQREYADGDVVAHGGIARDVQSERRLAH